MRNLRVSALALALLLVLSGCGAGSGPSGHHSAGPSATNGAGSASIDDAPAAASSTSPSAGVRLPPVAAKADYQLGGAYTPPAGTKIVSRDVTAAPAKGLYNICYVNAFQTQPGQRNVSALVLRDASGKSVADPDWPDEYLYDISTPHRRALVMAVIGPQIDACHRRGFNAVEPDNLDSWTRSKKLLTRADAIAFATRLVARAHADQLAIAQKNTTDLLTTKLGFDFAVAEECQTYDECGEYATAYGRHVIEIEYVRKQFRAACAARSGRWSIVLRDRDVVPAGAKGYVHATC